MQKPMVFMVIMGCIMAVGMAMSFYGSQIIIQDLVSEQTELISGSSFEISAELDPSISKTGAYVVQTMNFKEDSISAKIFDPFDVQIVSKTIEASNLGYSFEITASGTYRLIVENFGTEKTIIITGLGHMPDTSKYYIVISGNFFLIIGMIGIVGVGIYAFKKRQK